MMALSSIKETTARYYGLNAGDLESRDRNPGIARARFVAFALAREHHFSLSKIGISFRRDHTTVLHGLNRVKEMLQADETFSDELDHIRSQCQARHAQRIERFRAHCAMCGCAQEFEVQP